MDAVVKLGEIGGFNPELILSFPFISVTDWAVLTTS